MCLYNVIAQAEAQACALPGGLGGKEGLEYFIPESLGIPLPLSATRISIPFFVFFVITETVGVILRWGGLFFLIDRIEGIVEQVQDHPPDFLGNDFYFPDGVIVFGFNDCVEGFVPRPQAVIGQADIFINQGIDVCRFFLAVTAPAVLQHAFDDTIGAFAMVVDFFQFILSCPRPWLCASSRLPFAGLFIQSHPAVLCSLLRNY